MRYPILISIFLFTLFSACKKDEFATAPSLKFKSVNTTTLRTGQQIQFTLSFTDAEGDLSNKMYVEEIAPGCALSSFTDSYPIPGFPSTKNQKGDITVTFGFNSTNIGLANISPKCQKNDTAVFRFALTDLASNTSDTVSSPPIILVY
ncbi:MAG: hypothetical protein ABIN25_03415 [Ginsengibacter sp.]